MNTRANLREVFVECNSRGIMTSLDDSYCFSEDVEKVKNSFRSSSKHIGYVYANEKPLEQIMEDIDGEGSSTVYWSFEGRTKKNRAKVGYILAEVFQQMGYIVEWDESMEPKIAAVIEEEDLPENFLKNWRSANDEVEEEDEIESFGDTPDTLIPPPNTSVSDEEAEFGSESEEEYLSAEVHSSTLLHSSRASTTVVDESELELSDIEDDGQDEIDNDRMDPDANVVFTKEEEQENIFQSDDESESEDEEDDELSGPIIDPSSDEESEPEQEPANEDSEEDEDVTVCPPDCECVNCEAEREEAEQEA